MNQKTVMFFVLTATLSPLTSADNHQSLEARVAALESSWFQNLICSGLIEVEASYSDPDAGNTTSDVVVATAELAFEGQITEALSATITLLHEEDDTPLEVDIATLTYDMTNAITLNAGQDYLPFGAFETALVNDPLTLALGETRETALALSAEQGLFSGTVYVFNGDQDEDNRDQTVNFGAGVRMADEGFTIGLDYISNLADSDGLQDNDYNYGTGEDAVAGASIYGAVNLGDINLYIEQLGALDPLAGDGNTAEPNATQLEISVAAGDITYAIAYQETDEALFLDLPEQRISLGLSTEITEGLGLGVEFNQDDDYGTTEGGTGQSTNSLVLQLAAEF